MPGKSPTIAPVQAATASNQNKSLPWRDVEHIALAGLGALVAAGLWHEARKRTVTNGTIALVRNGQWLGNAAVVRPGKAASAMAWHAYSNGKTPMPSYTPDNRLPLVDNISTATLQEIAKGALHADPQLTRRERRAIERMAKLLVAERRRESK